MAHWGQYQSVPGGDKLAAERAHPEDDWWRVQAYTRCDVSATWLPGLRWF